ncbi:hypothetical protein F383_08298 [Gossypium arboreum]|uniref:Uncharacterized protein n=1 Tax=Gossypium arboreum TaxID=29729 RepID=A0A0B0PIH6_GOSAR|nr:hypothetical protein F383_25286 [Gossypium arboreum]KHG23186.1 hypothetical protein F383_08298 [Gossypium arboreum]
MNSYALYRLSPSRDNKD